MLPDVCHVCCSMSECIRNKARLLLVEVSWVRLYPVYSAAFVLEGVGFAGRHVQRWGSAHRDAMVIAVGRRVVVVAGGAAVMHQNCLPEGKMSNRCLSGQKEPAAIFCLPFSFSLPSYRTLMEGRQRRTNLSTSQMTSCSAEKRQRHYG